MLLEYTTYCAKRDFNEAWARVQRAINNQKQMENYISIDGKKIKLSDETARELKEQLSGGNDLPKSWEELGDIDGFYVSSESDVYDHKKYPSTPINKNIWPTKEEAEAALAMSQLAQLRDRYNDNWKPDWTDNDVKYAIYFSDDEIRSGVYFNSSHFLSFKTAELRDTFLENFRELIIKAKPLL